MGWRVYILSAKVDVRGTMPVRRTVRMPRVMKLRPRERQKYSSSARAEVSKEVKLGKSSILSAHVESRVSVERSITTTFGL